MKIAIPILTLTQNLFGVVPLTLTQNLIESQFRLRLSVMTADDCGASPSRKSTS